MWLEQTEIQELEDTFLWEHPTKLANTWERGAKPVFGAIAVPAGEAASLFLSSEPA